MLPLIALKSRAESLESGRMIDHSQHVSAISLVILEVDLSIIRLPADVAVPEWALRGAFFSITRAVGELSVVCDSRHVPTGSVQIEAGWRGLAVVGPLDFALTGVMSAIAGALAGAAVSIFAISTFDTDYVLVKSDKLEDAVKALRGAGMRVTKD